MVCCCLVFICVNDDVIVNGVGWVEIINIFESKFFVLFDFCDYRVGFVEEFFRFGVDSFIVENFWVVMVWVVIM